MEEKKEQLKEVSEVSQKTSQEASPVQKAELDSSLVRTMQKDITELQSKTGVPAISQIKKSKKSGKVLKIFAGVFVVLLIISISGGIFYWQYYLSSTEPVIATHRQCQNCQCVVVEGEGANDCLTDSECQPTEPSLPVLLAQVSNTEIINILVGEEILFKDNLKSEIAKEQPLSTIKRILPKIVDSEEICAGLSISGGKYANLSELISLLGINISDEISQQFYSFTEQDYLLFSHSQLEGNRLGLSIKLKQEANLSEMLKNWEESILTDLKSMLLQEEVPEPTSFEDNIYKDIAIRYINFPDPDLSIDYAVFDNKLIITTSRESMYGIIDVLTLEEYVQSTD